MIRVTVDTGPWLDLLDRRGCAAEMDQILGWHKVWEIRLFASSRVFDPDTTAMHPHQTASLQSLFAKHGIEIAGAAFRFDISRLNGPDLISGPPTTRSQKELKRFIEVVGQDPSTLPASAIGGTFGRKVGDYDALQTHFASGNEVFVTLDTKDYLHTSRRARYERELGLVVQSPAELIAAHTVRRRTS